MIRRLRSMMPGVATPVGIFLAAGCTVVDRPAPSAASTDPVPATVVTQRAARRDRSDPLRPILDLPATIAAAEPTAPGRLSPPDSEEEETAGAPAVMRSPRGAADVEQRTMGTRPAAEVVASFDGLGTGFEGPQGTATLRNPSDNSLAVGPDHVVQVVNSRMAIFTRKGVRYATSGTVLYGPVETRNVFRDFGGPCETRNNGDAVARYDQLAKRWLIVMPIFSRVPVRQNEPSAGRDGEPARRSQPGQLRQPGEATPLFRPSPPAPVATATTPPVAPSTAPAAPPAGAQPRPVEQGTYGMCYAVSTGPDPLGPYYRYEFIRPLFPDYPRPAVWPDGWYIPTSTGDEVIQKHACIAERAKMLLGLEATEQCVIIDGVNFLNNADLDGTQLPPAGAPNLMFAAGGTQLKGLVQDSALYVWSLKVDWRDPAKTKLQGPVRLPVAPYAYLCGGQLTSCVPQPGTERRLDAQGDKLMARVIYRRRGTQQSIVAAHSVNTSTGGGGVRWYEYRLTGSGLDGVRLHQQGTYAPDGFYRWMPSPAMDGAGNIVIGYSFGGSPNFAGQRLAGRLAGDPLGTLSLHETTLVEGEAAQTTTLRWEDYTQTAVDPVDDCTIWYVGDYLKAGATNYSSRIAAVRLPGCGGSRR